MSIAETFNPSSINLSARAIQKVRGLVADEENDQLKLRVFITGGGCSGFQYGFTFDELVADDDTALEADGVTLLVDPMSLQYLVGRLKEMLFPRNFQEGAYYSISQMWGQGFL